jgi:hypothetical protein
MVAPGAHWDAPQMTSCSILVVPSGMPNHIGQLRVSNQVAKHDWPFSSPMTGAPLGSARIQVAQLQLSRAIRPPQRTEVIVAPGGAVNAWPEWWNPE